MRTLLLAYRSASNPMRWQFWMSFGMVAFAGTSVLSGQASVVATSTETIWVTPQNIISLAFLVYGVGMTVQQFRDQQRRLTDLERFRNEDVPRTYVRLDVYEADGHHRRHGDKPS